MSEISKEALASMRFRCEARMPFQAGEVLPLIAEVERLREENSRQAQLIERIEQDEAATKTHAIACSKSEEHWMAEVERLRAILRDVAGSGVALDADPPGLPYATVQIDADLWAQVRREFGEKEGGA